MTLDETRVLFEGRYLGLLYDPTKPIKLAFEFFSIADQTGYLWDIISRFAHSSVKRTSVLLDFVEQLPTSSVAGGTYHFLGDSHFGSVSLLESLEERGYLGTFACKKNQPSYLWTNVLHVDLQKGQEHAVRKDHLLAVSVYSREKVNLLSNAFSLGSLPQYQPGKVLEYYDNHKHSVDHFNQLLAAYYYRHRHSRWTQAFLTGIFNIAVTNAYVMYSCVAQNPVSHRAFLEYLIQDFIRC